MLALLTTLLAGSATAVSPPYDPFFATQATVADFLPATRPFGVAAADYDADGDPDLLVGRTTGNVALVRGNGDGTFGAPAVFAWKQAFFNAWALAAGDLNGDGNADVVWGSTALSSGCSISPIPAGQTCATAGGTTVTVNDGDVRVFYGNGDGTFAENTYFVSGVRHNAGALLADVGTDAGSVATADVDADGDLDVVAGAVDGSNSVVRLLRNDGAGAFAAQTLVNQPAGNAVAAEPISWPASMTVTSPWGLAFGDADGDSDADLFVADRALYVYLFRNDGAGTFALQGGNAAVSGRPNVYLGHDGFRAAVGFTASLGAGDVNGDGKADLALGIQSGAQAPATNTPHDGRILLDVSSGAGHTGFGPLADIGTNAHGVTVLDVDRDGANDILAAEHDGKIKLLRQLPPLDSDDDGVSDYVDNAPEHANAPRIDMNADGSLNFRDQLDNDFDTVLGNPEDASTWQRLGDAADPDDDNDGIADGAENCVFVANPGQENQDGDALGDACDPLDDRDPDDDGVPTGPLPGDAGHAAARAAAILWSTGDTHFVIRIDALGRFFQNEFTQLMTDAATLSPEEWAAKCWENYEPGDIPGYEPCGTGEGTPEQTLTLPGGKQVPVTLVVIPKQLWTDPPVIAWVDDRNDNPLFELGQHGTYHANNIPFSDWRDLPDRDFYSCEACGLSEAEAFELLKVGSDTLLGNYANRWVDESGATAASAAIDWASSANPLISYAPPFNTSDAPSRNAVAQLGFKGFSASVFEEGEVPGSYGGIFTPEGSHHERFSQFGSFHASADVELEPPDTTGDSYDAAEYGNYLQSQVDDGGLTTWLIEEVEWSGRPCPNDDRLGLCGGGSNRENNTVYRPRWDAWLQLLDFVKSYPGGVAMTMGEVALAKGFDNAPTAANPGQADADHDGVGDAIDGAALEAAGASLTRNESGTLSATLRNGAGEPISAQTLAFSLDADGDGDGEPEVYAGTTDADGVASVAVTPTRPVGGASYSVSWDGLRATAEGGAAVTVGDTTTLALDAANPSSGQVTDAVAVSARLVDSDGAGVPGRTVTFSIGGDTASAVTGSDGSASASVTLSGPARAATLEASFAGDELYGPSETSVPFTVAPEDTVLALPDAVAARNDRALAVATLTEADGAPLAGRRVTFLVEDRTAFVVIGTATTGAAGSASLEIPARYVSTKPRPIRATVGPDGSFLGATADAVAYRLAPPG